MPSNHLILCQPLLLRPSILPSIRAFSNESALRIRWPEYWCFSFSISPSSEYSELISFTIDWFDSRDSQDSSPTPQFKSISSLVLSLLYGPTVTSMASLVAQLVKNSPAMWESWVQSLSWEDPGKATHSSILDWRIPWTV